MDLNDFDRRLYLVDSDGIYIFIFIYVTIMLRFCFDVWLLEVLHHPPRKRERSGFSQSQ